jgi:hypothetical protein
MTFDLQYEYLSSFHKPRNSFNTSECLLTSLSVQWRRQGQLAREAPQFWYVPSSRPFSVPSAALQIPQLINARSPTLENDLPYLELPLNGPLRAAQVQHETACPHALSQSTMFSSTPPRYPLAKRAVHQVASQHLPTISEEEAVDLSSPPE